MPVTATTVEIARGLTMPFIPMKPKPGEPIRTRSEMNSALAELQSDDLVIQPTLAGIRACLAVVDKNIFIQNASGKWITQPPRNGRDYLKLPNNTCLDGYISHDYFYTADCLSVRGQSFIYKTAAEREAVAYQLVRFLDHPWRFARPTAKFIRAARHNLPEYRGLTLKDYMSFYALLSSNRQVSKEWRHRDW